MPTLKTAFTFFAFSIITFGYSQRWMQQNSNTTSRLNAVHFADANHGCAVGNDGTICTTSDGGITWVVQNSGTSSHISAVHFIDALVGFAVTPNQLLKTVDGGNNWFVQESTNGTSHPIFFMDSKRGFVAGRRQLLKTVDGGNNWFKQDILDLRPHCFWAIDTNIFLNGGMGGTALGPVPVMSLSIDGGSNWHITEKSNSYGAYDCLFFTNQYTGYAAEGSQAQGNYYNKLKKTTDRGASWHNLGFPGSVVTSIHFVDEQIGYITSANGEIYKTNDAGKNWISLITTTSSNLLAIHFPDSATGYAVGDNGTILKSYNGNIGAINIFPNPSSDKLTIDYKNQTVDEIYITNLMGEILETHNNPIQVIDISDFPSGVYLINFRLHDVKVTKKFIKILN